MQIQDLAGKGERRVEAEISPKKKNSWKIYTPENCQGRRERTSLLRKATFWKNFEFPEIHNREKDATKGKTFNLYQFSEILIHGYRN